MSDTSSTANVNPYVTVTETCPSAALLNCTASHPVQTHFTCDLTNNPSTSQSHSTKKMKQLCSEQDLIRESNYWQM